jgi:hypothetical protein
MIKPDSMALFTARSFFASGLHRAATTMEA